MKKIISIAILFVMLFSLCACEQIEQLQGIELPELPKAETSEEPTGEAPKVQEQPAEATVSKLVEASPLRIIAAVTKTEEQFFDPAEGKQLILDFSYETPHVDILDRDEAANAINEYIAMLDETYCTGNDYGDGAGNGLNMLLELATDNFTYAYETGNDVSLELSSNRTVSVERADSAVLSLLYYSYLYMGGAHGEYNYRGYVFDTEDGSLVTLDKLLTDTEKFEDVALEYMKAAMAEDDEAFPDVSDESLLGLVRDGSWYLGKSGVTIFPDLYEIASYADGIKMFEIPYETLAGLVNEKYLPPEYAGEGELSVIPQSEFEDGSMEVVDKIVTAENGEELCLIVSGTVYDVRISSVAYTDYTGKFYETAHLWNCSYMTDCAVQIQTMIPDGMPDMLISYRAADGTQVNRLLTQSGEDGSLILVEDDIAAVG